MIRANIASGSGQNSGAVDMTPGTQFRIEKIVKAKPLHSRAIRMPTWETASPNPTALQGPLRFSGDHDFLPKFLPEPPLNEDHQTLHPLRDRAFS
jgi:hypothetical protein